MSAEAAIRMQNITKSFGSVIANDHIDFAVQPGEIHALLGENGAGKSTLMNMLSGIYRPDSGSIFINGEEVHFSAPRDAIKKGIGMIHQHFKLVDIMTARDNIILGQKSSFFTRETGLNKKISEISDRYGLDVNPQKKVYQMSVGEKQTLEIIKVLYRGAHILIMDEPTAVLTPQEIGKLFRIIRSLKEQGCAVIIITHKLGEVMEISDRITVLRKGRSIGTVNTADAEIPSLIEMMVGRKVDLKIKREALSAEQKKELLRLDAVTVIDKDGKAALDDVSFSLNTAEILGVAGVAGSGQKELCETIAGLQIAEKGRIFFNEENILGKSPREIIKLGIRMGFIPEDRLGMGLVASMDIIHNIILKEYQSQKGIVLHRKSSIEKAGQIVERLDIQTPGLTTSVGKLSGGNIQKVLLGREIDSNPKVLITAYPVRGLDIGASYKIYDLLNEQKRSGVGVIFIGEDLDVLLELCDRILVLTGGKITGIVDAPKVSKEEIGFLMTGGMRSGGVSS
ncbi:MAG: ABC transporter ATP-binding protein [Clostridiales Family XIII bacterium]|jgi:simple sugar transport system ATP-binding protein|nr:ABC transporter ATP-binding protein [Clostridiales Family XIII bacterium]